MNIFVLDKNPINAAQMQCDKHVVKMILESAQLLSTAMHMSGLESPYKPTHINHPCSIWVRRSKGNAKWLLDHFKALCSEYTYRYGKIHKCTGLTKIFEGFVGSGDDPMTDFVKCMPDEFRTLDVVEAYQAYHKTKGDWIYNHKNRNIPEFLVK